MKRDVNRLVAEFTKLTAQDKDAIGVLILHDLNTGKTKIYGGATAKQFSQMLWLAIGEYEKYFREIGGKEYRNWKSFLGAGFNEFTQEHMPEVIALTDMTLAKVTEAQHETTD